MRLFDESVWGFSKKVSCQTRFVRGCLAQTFVKQLAQKMLINEIVDLESALLLLQKHISQIVGLRILRNSFLRSKLLFICRLDAIYADLTWLHHCNLRLCCKIDEAVEGKQSVQWCRKRWCRGTSAPQKFWFGENRAKSLKIRAKSMEIWAKYLKTFAMSGQKWRRTWFDLKHMAPNVCRIIWRPFYGGHPNTSAWENVRTKSGPKVFQAIVGKSGQKSFAPLKICLLLHPWISQFGQTNQC